LLLLSFVLSGEPVQKLRIAILEFTNNNVEKEIAEAVVENLYTSFISSGYFEVVERAQLIKLLDELNLQNSDDFNDELRDNLGNLYGTELVILGSVTLIGQQITINLRGVDVETGVARVAKNVTTSDINELTFLIPNLVDDVVNKEFKLTSKKKEPKKEKKEVVKKDPEAKDNLTLNRRKSIVFMSLSFGISLTGIITGACLLGVTYPHYKDLNSEAATLSDADRYARAAVASLVIGIVIEVTGVIFFIPAVFHLVKVISYSLRIKNSKQVSQARFLDNLNIQYQSDKLNFYYALRI
ncbi:MAG: CsgG/HfaB family protein, partial [Spirochaetes bacterium]|nr:CsgG/HfaB family protein [Spirochaetota bacterium]